MAKQKKRGFFSWLGFGDKEQKQEQTEEQQIVEEQRPAEPPVETAADVDAQTPAHSKAETKPLRKRWWTLLRKFRRAKNRSR